MARSRLALAAFGVLGLGASATAPAMAAGDGALHASATFIDPAGTTVGWADLVEDASGRIAVEPEGAKIVAERILSRFGPGEAGSEGLRLGRFALRSVPGLSSRRTLGSRYAEHAIPIDREVYVLAEAGDSAGRLRMQRPSAKGGRFIISLKGEEELSRRARLAAVVLRSMALAAGLGALAVVLQAGAKSSWSLADYGVSERPAQCAYGLALYVRKTLWAAGRGPV